MMSDLENQLWVDMVRVKYVNDKKAKVEKFIILVGDNEEKNFKRILHQILKLLQIGFNGMMMKLYYCMKFISSNIV